MYKLWVIAYREYSAMVATKAFLVTLVMMPVLMFGGILLMPKLNSLGGGKTQRVIVADGTGQLFAVLEAAASARNAALREKQEGGAAPNATERARDDISGAQDFYKLEAAPSGTLSDEQRLQLSDEIRQGRLYAFVEIPASLLSEHPAGTKETSSAETPENGADSADASSDKPATATFVSQDSLLSATRQWISAVVGENVRVARLRRMGLDPVAVSMASRPVEFVPLAPLKHDADGNGPKAQAANMLVALLLPFGIMMLMFMVIFLAAQPMLESGMEEKSHRIAEVLLGSVSPTQLMAGKLLGNVCGSLVIFAVYGFGGWLLLSSNDWSKDLPWSLLPWFVVFQLLGVLFFSSIFLTVGASISELKEAQSLLMPIWLFMLAPMMIWLVALRDPNGPVATTLSMFPPSAPLMMILRLASGRTIPWWHPPLSALLLIIATALVVKLAGRIYKASLLRTDSARSFRQLLARLGG